MASERKTCKDFMRGVELSYSDDFLYLKGERHIPSNSFTYNEYEALQGVRDYSTNNFSNLFLTRRGKNEDFLSTRTIASSAYSVSSVNTTLSIGGTFIRFDKDTSDYAGVTFVKNSDSYCLFSIHFVSGSKCFITFTTNEGLYYLARQDKTRWKLDENIWNEEEEEWESASSKSNEELVFSFGEKTYWDYLKMEPNENDSQSDGSTFLIGDFSGTEKLYISRVIDEETQIDALRLETEATVKDFKNRSIKANDFLMTSDLLTFPMNESWVAYDNDRIIGGIDDTRGISFRNLSGQLLIHHEYNAGDGVNIIPLKNNVSYMGNSFRGAYATKDGEYTPSTRGFSFRMYNSINSGFNQERGRGSILLNYTFRE